MLAEQIGAGMFVMLTDVAGVFIGYGTKDARVIAQANPQALADMPASFGAGSMGPKVAAACHFVSVTGQPAAIGALGDLSGIIAGSQGTIVAAGADAISFRDRD